jgi:hypothetical protein
VQPGQTPKPGKHDAGPHGDVDEGESGDEDDGEGRE